MDILNSNTYRRTRFAAIENGAIDLGLSGKSVRGRLQKLWADV